MNLLFFQDMINKLNDFWAQQGCIIIQPFDLEIGAGTFHPMTFLKAIGPEPWYAAHVQASRRATDGRYGDHPHRSQHFYQYQVVLKPSPINIQNTYINSLKILGINPLEHDIRFVEDNWEGPTLGAWGLGWEVWLNGLEITQFTYFQQVGGLTCFPITGEIAYGIERIAMYLQGVQRIQDLIWTINGSQVITYEQLFQQNEKEMSKYNFETADIDMLFRHFNDWEQECEKTLNNQLPCAAYEMVLKASHIFNLLDARNAISSTERQNYILRVRNLAKKVAQIYYKIREQQKFPLLDNQDKNNDT